MTENHTDDTDLSTTTGDAELDEALEVLEETVDPEADAIVDDALDIDSLDEAIAADAATHDEADVTAELDDAPAVEVEPEEDPYADFKKELRRKPGNWYVVHSYAGYEKKVKTNIENRVIAMNMQDDIYEVAVPLEDIVDIKNGQRKLVTRVRVPSYVLVRMTLNENSWSTVRHTPGVTGFVGNAHNPIPLSFQDAFDMLKTEAPIEGARSAGGLKSSGQREMTITTDFEVNETVGIKEGAFAGLQGTIHEIHLDTGKVSVFINVFGRDTAVEFTFSQIEKQ